HSDDARARLLGVVYHEAVQMHRMVENLLDLARLRSGDAGGERSWQAIEEIVGSSLEAVRRRPVDRVFAVDVPADLPLLRCDGVLIERVLVNLLENAIKYSPAGSRIALQAGVDDREIVIAVSDQGPGVPADLRDKVFEPFFRAGDNAGSGLGLTICRGIVEAHGGSVQLGTAAGGGARVVVRLPLPAEPPELASEPEPGERHG
ncbi:MAG: sensor histidine kinase, partial [Gammaproteobacteria bacterium]